MTLYVAAGAVLACVGCAMSQQVLTDEAALHYEVSWIDSGNGNGVLEPGESATIVLRALMTPPVNTVVGYTTNGQPLSGTLRGIASGFLDGRANNTLGGTMALGFVNPSWDLLGNVITYGPDGVRGIEFAQFPTNNNAIMTTNPIEDLFDFVWTPSSYTPRTVTWVPAGYLPPEQRSSAVYIITGSTTRVVAMSLSAFSGLEIPVVPSPGSGLAVAGLVAAIGCRRGR